MEPRPAPLPHFRRPPLIELALAVQFKSLEGLNVPILGLLWQRFRDRFPAVEEHPPLDPMIEVFGERPTVRAEFRLLTKPPLPRLWFLDREGTELIQVQHDRFAHNWRKQRDVDTYPRYHNIRDTFALEMNDFCAFVAQENLGGLEPNLCDITYVDHVPVGEGVSHPGHLGALLRAWDPNFRDERFGEPEEAGCFVRFLMKDDAGNPFGRLHIDTHPAFRRSDGQPILVMQTTGRGHPLGSGVDGALAFLDKVHDEIVRCFIAMTRTEMHKHWGLVS